MTWNDRKQVAAEGGFALDAPDLGCLLFAPNRDAAARQCAFLEEHGIFAQVGSACGPASLSGGLGIPLVVAPDETERANLILASLEASYGGAWDEEEDDLDDDFDDDEDEDDDDDFFPDDDEDEKEEDDFEDDDSDDDV